MTEPELHAPKFACSSNIWIDCPGSVWMQERYPTLNDDNYLAKQGKVAHTVALDCLTQGLRSSEDRLGEIIDGWI